MFICAHRNASSRKNLWAVDYGRVLRAGGRESFRKPEAIPFHDAGLPAVAGGAGLGERRRRDSGRNRHVHSIASTTGGVGLDRVVGRRVPRKSRRGAAWLAGRAFSSVGVVAAASASTAFYLVGLSGLHCKAAHALTIAVIGQEMAATAQCSAAARF